MFNKSDVYLTENLKDTSIVKKKKKKSSPCLSYKEHKSLGKKRETNVKTRLQFLLQGNDVFFIYQK